MLHKLLIAITAIFFTFSAQAEAVNQPDPQAQEKASKPSNSFLQTMPSEQRKLIYEQAANQEAVAGGISEESFREWNQQAEDELEGVGRRIVRVSPFMPSRYPHQAVKDY